MSRESLLAAAREHGDDELIFAVEAAFAGGDIVAASRSRSSFSITAKGHDDHFTDADTGSQIEILGVLRRHGVNLQDTYPEELVPGFDCGFVSALRPETNGWLIDPLDGTMDFGFHYEKGRTSVMIARRFEGRTKLGVVYFPLTGELYYAFAGRGAYYNGQRIRTPGTFTKLAEAGVTFNLQKHVKKESRFIRNLWNRLAQPGVCRFRDAPPAHSGLTVRTAAGHLCAGAHDGSPQARKQMPHDIAPTLIFAEEAGAAVLSDQGKSIDPFWEGPFVVASTPELAREIVELGSGKRSGRPAR